VEIKILGAHSSISDSANYITLLINGTTAIDAGCLASSLSLSSQANLKTILVTHAHYDHIRDIPALTLNRFFNGESIDIFGTDVVISAITDNILNGVIYPKFQEIPQSRPTVVFHELIPNRLFHVDGFEVQPIPVRHNTSTVGYYVKSADGDSFFYTADSGPGLSDCWKDISPDLLIIETTLPDKLEAFATMAGHLTPHLLKKELEEFRYTKGYVPRIVVVHMEAAFQREIETEVAAVSRELDIPISVGYEGMNLEVKSLFPQPMPV
jgi:ribonuclease BN (tRNA processing enzyme)